MGDAALKQKSICLFGTYAEDNTGDDLMLASQIKNIRARDPECRFVIFTGTREHTQKLLYRENIGLESIKINYTGRRGLLEPSVSFPRSLIWIFQNVREIRRADLLIIGPGNQIQDVTRRFRVVFFLAQAVLAWILRTSYAFMGIGFYELRSSFCRWLFRVTCNRAAFISTRDRGGGDKIRELGVRRTEIFPLADVSFTHKWKVSDKWKGRDERREDDRGAKLADPPLIGFSYRIFLPEVFPPAVVENLGNSLAGLLLRIKERMGARFLFFPYYKGSHWNDSVALEQLVLRFEDNSFEDNSVDIKTFDFNNLNELFSGISECDAIIGVRYHSVLMSVQAGVPVMGISYAHKTQRFMQENGLEEYVLRVEDVSIERLWARWEKLWSDRVRLREIYPDICAHEKKLARKHVDLIFDTIYESG